MEYIGKISALVVDSSTNNVILLGDVNVDINTLFETELIEMCDSLDLLISDYKIFERFSCQFTHVSDAHNTTYPMARPYNCRLICIVTMYKGD